MDNALLCAVSSAAAICRAIGSASSRTGPLRDPIRQRWPFDELHDQGANGRRGLEPVDARNVGMVERRERRASRSNRARRSASCANASGRTLIATWRPSAVSVARYTSPMPPLPSGAVTWSGPILSPERNGMAALRPETLGVKGRSRRMAGRGNGQVVRDSITETARDSRRRIWRYDPSRDFLISSDTGRWPSQ